MSRMNRRITLLLLLAIMAGGCGGNSDSDRNTESVGNTESDGNTGGDASPNAAPEPVTSCTPKLDPTAALGLPGIIRIGDDPLQTEILQQDTDKGSLPGSPLDDLPPHITRLTETGQRAAWSPDGSRILYQDNPIGDVLELDLATRETRELTAPFDTAGFLRAHYLPNGDLLLCGPEERDPAIEDDGRFRGKLWVHQAPFDEPPVPLGESCWEGVAVDPFSSNIAWNISDINFNDPDVFLQALVGQSEIHMGRIVYQNGEPALVDRRKVVDRRDAGLLGLDAVIEAQDFRHHPDGRREIIFTAYFHLGGQVMGKDLDSGKVTNYSQAPLTYNEAEGIHPSGETVMVERDRAFELFPAELDIWRLTLDGSGKFERMTFFTRHCGFGATNPVVAPNGRRFAFQLERKQDGPFGAGFGLLLFDLDMWDAANP